MGKLPEAPTWGSNALFCSNEDHQLLEHGCMPRYVIERAFPDRFDIPLSADGSHVSKDVVARNAEAGVTWLHSYVSDDKKRSYCVYDAPNPEAIRRAAKHNNLPVSHITEVRVFDPYFHRP